MYLVRLMQNCQLIAEISILKSTTLGWKVIANTLFGTPSYYNKRNIGA